MAINNAFSIGDLIDLTDRIIIIDSRHLLLF